MKKVKNRTKSNEGFSLAELLIVAAILAVVLSGILQLYIHSSIAAKLAGNKTLAVVKAQDMIEEIRNMDFDNIYSDNVVGDTGNPFAITQIEEGTIYGVYYISEVYAEELYEIEAVVSWEDKYGRIIGEDTNRNGVLDAGEDINGDNRLNSIVAIKSMITRR